MLVERKELQRFGNENLHSKQATTFKTQALNFRGLFTMERLSSIQNTLHHQWENPKLSNESLQENGTATRWSNIMVSFSMVHNSGIFWKYVWLFFNYCYCGKVVKINGGVRAWQLVVSVLSLPSLASNVDTATLENSLFGRDKIISQDYQTCLWLLTSYITFVSEMRLNCISSQIFKENN